MDRTSTTGYQTIVAQNLYQAEDAVIAAASRPDATPATLALADRIHAGREYGDMQAANVRPF